MESRKAKALSDSMVEQDWYLMTQVTHPGVVIVLGEEPDASSDSPVVDEE